MLLSSHWAATKSGWRVAAAVVSLLATLLLTTSFITARQPAYQYIAARAERPLEEFAQACNVSHAASPPITAVDFTTAAATSHPTAQFRSRSSPANFNFSTPIWSRGYGELVMRDNPKYNADYLTHGTEDMMNYEDLHKMWHLSEAQHFRGFIWVRTQSSAGHGAGSDVLEFVAHIMPYITEPFVLISSDGDVSTPADMLHDDCATIFQRVVDNPFLIAWYTQNYVPFQTTSECNVTTDKVRPLPIGLDLHTWSGTPQQKVEVMRQVQREVIDGQLWTARKHRIMADLNSKSHTSRVTLEQLLMSSGAKHIDFHQREPFEQAMRSFGSYKFALSPRGNGLDCHRTWELLMMKTIPIVLTSSLDGMYAGLPVVIVQSWQEVLVEENLNKWEQQHLEVIRAGNPDEWLDPWRWLAAPLTNATT